MDDSERDESPEPTGPSEPTPPDVDLADEEGFPEVVYEPSPIEEDAMATKSEKAEESVASSLPKPAKPATAGIYTYKGKEETYHPKLGLLQPGKNDYTGLTHPEMLQALGELVAAGEMVKA